MYSRRQKHLINEIVGTALKAENSRREGGRYSFFQPVSVQVGDRPQLLSAFLLEVSDHDVRILHWCPFEFPDIDLWYVAPDGAGIVLTVWTISCQQLSGGWYVTHARYLAVNATSLEEAEGVGRIARLGSRRATWQLKLMERANYQSDATVLYFRLTLPRY